MYPPFLRKNDKVIIVSPSGSIDINYIKGASNVLLAWGLKVQVSAHAYGKWGRFSGTKEERIIDLQGAIDDKECKAILCSRGGYGLVQIIDKIDMSAFGMYPKWIIGFSDITVLHSLTSQFKCASIHSIMAKHLTLLSSEAEPVVRLRELLFGKKFEYILPLNKFNRTGNFKGTLVGGNLSVLYGLRGTSFDLNTYGKILFLEDVGEKPYHIDRMMQNLRLGGILENLSGLIIGQFSDCEEDPLMGNTIYENIRSYVEGYNYPVCFDFPSGHVEYNLPLVLNSLVDLKVGDENVTLNFSV